MSCENINKIVGGMLDAFSCFEMFRILLSKMIQLGYFKCLIRMLFICVGVNSSALISHAQITITSKDMFSEEGHYYKMYSNFVQQHSSDDTFEEVDAADYIGNEGGDQVWDFREGPDDEQIRFDYVRPSEIDTNVEFEGATIAERATFKSSDSQKSLFLNMKKGVGRYVYGFHDPSVDEETPSVVFSGRLLDFPAVIRYEDEWNASTSYEIKVKSLGLVVPTKLVYESSMKVDAYGIVILPNLGFHDCLRINELVKYDQFVKIPGLGDDWMNAGSVYVRNYYWLSKDMGIVSQITSTQDTAPIPEDFTAATAIWRQFENNHGESSAAVEPVEGLEITYDLKGNRVLLSWEKAENAIAYLIQYTDNFLKSDWKDLKETSGNFALDSIYNQKQRFYRIVSLE